MSSNDYLGLCIRGYLLSHGIRQYPKQDVAPQ